MVICRVHILIASLYRAYDISKVIVAFNLFDYFANEIHIAFNWSLKTYDFSFSLINNHMIIRTEYL